MTETETVTETAAAGRQRPAINKDNAFFFEELRHGRVSAQCCTGCGELRHPPVPMCPHCHSLDWSAKPLSGAGVLNSYVVMHHPVVPPFQSGYVVALVELAEGVRMIMNLEGVPREEIEVGMPVTVTAEEVEPGLHLMVARAATGDGAGR